MYWKGIFNRDELLERVCGDEDLCEELLNDFLKDAPARLERLEQAVENNDASMAAEEAHSIKGASANIGAHALSDAALKMEMAGKAEDQVLIESLVTELKNEFEEFKNILP